MLAGDTDTTRYESLSNATLYIPSMGLVYLTSLMPSGSTSTKPTNWGVSALVVKGLPKHDSVVQGDSTLPEVATLVVMSIPNAVIELFNALSSGIPGT